MSPTTKVALAERHPHDFTIQYPPRREYFQDRFRGTVDLAQAFSTVKRALLYVHVPFCKAKCYYCNFAVDVRPDVALHRRYVDALISELAEAEKVLAGPVIGGIDIGGGTPTILPTDELKRLLRALQPFVRKSDARFPLSIETTPFIAASDVDKLNALCEGGVDRVSIGLQSTNDTMLAAVNRGQQIAVGETAIRNLQAAGFKRVSVDLIFALPGQTREHWLTDLKRVSDLRPDTITTYDCLYRGKGRLLTKRTPDKPTPERYGELYDLAYETLTACGYHAEYGSVNFSLHEGETGTSSYFEGRLLDGLPYLGVGNYASSLIGDAWAFAPYRVNDWLAAIAKGSHFPLGDVYRLPDAEMMAKYLLLSLSFGVIDGPRFGALFGRDVDPAFRNEVEFAVEQGWLQPSERGYGIVSGQFRNMHKIRSLFYSSDAMNWLNGQ